jgi:dTDP-4-amino-4,6-dideoxygalactose transaminase
VIRFRELSREVEEVRPQLERSLQEVLDDGRFILGERVESFERSFAAYCGATAAVGVASGTEAIAIALRAVGVRPGDEVVTAANTCVPTVAGIEGAGATPVLADVEPRTATLDPASLEETVTPWTRAVVVVHLYGQCADMDAIDAVARRHGLRVVEDAAHAHGAGYGGRRAGTLGHAAAFSFYPTKNLGALGDAGAVVTNDEEVAARARRLRSYGENGRGEASEPGWNSRLDAVQAVVLATKLPHLERWNERRRELARAYAGALEETSVEVPAELPGRRHFYHLYAVRSPERDALRERLRQRGIETALHYPRPVHRHAAYAHLRRAGDLAVSERLAGEVVSLPLYPQLSDDELDAVVRAVAE